MPNRIIKESALDSEDLDKLSHGAERLFWRLIVVADDFGRFEGSPQVVKARCFPRRVDKLKTSEVEKWMSELSPRIVRFYIAAGRRYGFFVNWLKHQQKRANKSKFPEPTEVEQNQDDSNCNQLQSNVLGIEIENRDRDRERAPTGAVVSSVIPEWLDATTWLEFRRMRSRIRKPLTLHAENLLIKDLAQLRAEGHDPNMVVEQSIKRSWQGLFAVVEGGKQGEPKNNAADDLIKRTLMRGL